MSEKPRSVGRESRSPAQEGSSKTLYEPLWPTETPNEASKGASARAPPQHTDPNEVSFKRKDQEATSKGSHSPDRWNVHRGIKYTSRTSQTEDSQRVIANLRQEARGRTPIKENPRNRVNASKRGNPEYSNYEESPDTSGSQFTAPRFETYNGRTDPVAHIGHYQQTMTVSRLNEPLMCLLFPSSLGEVAMRWFNQLGRPREMDTLLTMKLQDNEIIKNYSIRYWETYNDIDGRSEEVAIKAFKLGLPVDSGLRHSLVKRQPSSLVKLMNKIDRFVCLEEDGKGTTPTQTNTQPKVFTPKPPVRSSPAVKSLSGSSRRSKGNLSSLGLPKLIGNPDSRDTKLYCNYHKDTGHMTENCHKLKVHLEHLATEGHLDQYIDTKLSKMKGLSTTSRQPNTSDTVAAGIIHVIHDPLCSIVSTGSYRSQMQKAAHLRRSFSIVNSVHPAPICSVSGGVMEQVISFSDSDLKDVQLPHNDPLVVTLRIGNYDVERILIDQGALQRMRAIPSTLHQKLRFPTKDGVMELSGDQVTAKQCVLTAVKQKDIKEAEKTQRLMTITGTITSSPDQQSRRFCLVGLRRTGRISRACISFIKYRVRTQADSLETAEVGPKKGLNSFGGGGTPSGIWSNPRNTVPNMALKHGGGYHQIPMNKADQDKTAFITPRGTYCYKMMPFGLKNAGATYQRMVTKMFGHIIGKIVVVYIDDMLVKSLKEENHIADLLQVFNILRESRLRLNASKCTFGVSSGKFLGHIVSRRGIEPNPDQIAALVDSAEPRNIKQVQRLTGMVAALGRFISRSADKCKPFFRLLGKRSKFIWNEECSVAFQVSDHAVSAVLVREFGQEQKPVFFVSKAMDETELSRSSTRFGYREMGVIVDGASNSKGSGAGVVLVSPKGLILEQAVRLKFSASNNEAEYEALLISLRTVEGLSACHLQVFCDSQLVTNQVSGEYQARDERMSAYLATVRLLLEKFESVHVAQIGREHNSHADVLAKLATTSQPSWMDPILSYLVDNKLLEDRKEAKIIKRKAPKYWVSKEGLLYRRSFTGPYLLCVRPEMIQNFLFEIHEEICGSHTGGRSLAHRAISQGYWWPYMQADALKYVRECDKCQRFAPMIHQPARELNPLSSPWPFTQWGLDIVGPFPQAPGNKKFLITATDYFTKWIEAEPLSNIRDVDTKRFFWKNVITRFGIPWAAISDNGTQFESRLFKGFCLDLGIKNFFSSPGYPQSNGQAEASNKVILSGIKRKLEEAKGKWVEELPSVLWTHRTTAKKSIGETPYALAYGVEAVIPLEVGILTTRTTDFTVQTNEDNLWKDLDLLEERRDMAIVRPNEGKLGPNWEGPYKVTSLAGAESY
uniref:Uncharacterized protein n=1 Tax=Fagus sylvatica TaxID=28930 RepID=A0A2N9ENC7_FAGSY